MIMEEKATQVSIKEHNIGLIIKNVKENQSVTRIRLNIVTKLAKSTISDLVSYLIDKKVLSEGEKINSKLGKKPIILKFNKDFFYIIAINIGIGYITVAIANLFGDIIIKVKHRNDARGSRKNILNNIFNTVEEALKKSEINFKKIYLISIGTHGVVDPKSKVVTHAPYFKNWSGINLYEVFNKKYKKDVVVENSINLGTIGEQWKTYPNISNLIYLNVNYGVGAGIIINKKLVTGTHGSTGEISYLPILKNYDFERLKDNTLELGLFESQIDIAGIVNKVKEVAQRIKTDKNFKREIADIDFEYICKLYNDPNSNFIKKVIDEDVLKVLAIGIASVITIIDTEIVVISGAIIDLGEKFIKRLKDEVYYIVPFKPEIVTSSLKKDAIILGAVKFGINHMDNLFYNHFFSIRL